MNLLSKEELKNLSGRQDGHCISLFMPTYRTGPENQQNLIRFRNLLRQAEETLVSQNLRPQEVAAILEPAQALLGNALFWQHQSDGLAIFLSAGALRTYRIPERFDELLLVSDRFHIKPLLPLLYGQDHFFILALSQNSVRFLKATRYGTEEIELDDLPLSMADAIALDEPEKQIRFRAGTRLTGDRGAMLSGHGSELEAAKENILKYFRKIDKSLRAYLKDEQAPLVVAGVDFLFPIFKSVNTYPYLIQEGIAGNPESMGTDQLQGSAWKVVEPYFRHAQEEALAQYRQSSGTGLTSTDITEILPAAVHGRVGLLFAARGGYQWGVFCPDSGDITLQDQREPESEDLLDLASIHTFLNGGRVYVIPQQDIPGPEALAALFRY